MLGNIVEAGSVRITWDPATRLVHATLRDGPTLSAREAERLLPVLRGWTEACPHFDILLGVEGSPGEDERWRAQLGYWIATATTKPRIAIYGQDVDREGALAFALSSGLDVRFFAKEAEARQWLMGG